ncbi:MAG: SIS domain-containing protein, partial [Hyphomicrobiales bacterium]|nr:SIS domain-containing protein [Hyphomicrobiales bacterium]
IIAISFSPYTPFTVEIAREANARGVPVVAVTDTAMSPLAPFAKTWFEVAESDFAAFRSMSATFCLAIALATAVANARTREAAKS